MKTSAGRTHASGDAPGQVEQNVARMEVLGEDIVNVVLGNGLNQKLDSYIRQLRSR